MNKKIKVNIPGFGDRFCSNNLEFNTYINQYMNVYRFYKKGTNIYHNEYGPSVEWKNGFYNFFINGKFHRLNGPAYYNPDSKIKGYDIIGKYVGKTKKEFIENLANILIPINKIFYEN